MVRTLRERIEQHDNDYSLIEPFIDPSPISTTIIIPVYNQAELFSSTWKVLARQDELNKNPNQFQVIVVNDGSEEDIDSIVESNEFPLKPNYIKLQHNTGRSRARNTGIKESVHELIVFLDSDVLVPNGFFQAHWKIHNAALEKRSKAAVVGLAENIEQYDPRLRQSVNSKTINPDPKKDFRVYDDGRDWYPCRRGSRLLNESRYLKDFPVPGFSLPEMVVTHNASIRKQLLDEIGGFEESFKGWGLEDTHLGAKMIGAGAYIIPARETAVFKVQHPPRDGGNLGEQCRNNLAIYNRLLDQPV
ncbi:MAG TPA: glycosyltransferase [Candidatus Nanoarchaeia archaeon]|nr:glycosyltransferase [Candidatus Nanoarchaeia archaeon]